MQFSSQGREKSLDNFSDRCHRTREKNGLICLHPCMCACCHLGHLVIHLLLRGMKKTFTVVVDSIEKNSRSHDPNGYTESIFVLERDVVQICSWLISSSSFSLAGKNGPHFTLTATPLSLVWRIWANFNVILDWNESCVQHQRISTVCQ